MKKESSMKEAGLKESVSSSKMKKVSKLEYNEILQKLE